MADQKVSALTALGLTEPDPFNDLFYYDLYNGGTRLDRKSTPVDVMTDWMRRTAAYKCDFVGDVMPSYGDTGSSNQASSQHQGVVEVRATNSADQSAYWGPYKGVHLQGGAVRMFFIVRTDGTISNGTDRFTICVGLPNEGDAQRGRDGVYVQYSDDLNSGKWALITSSGGSSTSTDIGVTVATDTWYLIQIDINAGATQAQAAVATNGGAFGSTVTSTTNVYQDDCTLTAGIYKNTGTNQRKYHIDYVFFVKYLSTGR